MNKEEIKKEVEGCGRRFWSNKFGGSLCPFPLNKIPELVICGRIYYFEGKALCKDCKLKELLNSLGDGKCQT